MHRLSMPPLSLPRRSQPSFGARQDAAASRRDFLAGATGAGCAAGLSIASFGSLVGRAIAAERSSDAKAMAIIDGALHGIKANGQDADDDALDRAIAAATEAAHAIQLALTTNQYFRGGVDLILPPGPIRLLRGHVIRSAHIVVKGQGSGATVLLKAGGDFGDLLEIRDPNESNNVGRSGFVGLGAIDIGPTSGGALLRLTGCSVGASSDLATHNGFFGLHLDGVGNHVVSNVKCTGDRYFGQSPRQAASGEQGSAKPGSAFIAITQSGSAPSENLQLSDVTATGEGVAARLHHSAIRVECADVLFLRNAELGAVVEADVHVVMGGNRSVQSLQTSGIEFDNAAAYGLKLEGTTTGAVGDWIIEGRFFGHDDAHVLLDCASLAGATFKVTGTGAAKSPIVVRRGGDIEIVAPMLRGFATTAKHNHDLSGIDIRTNNVSVLGGTLKPYAPRDLAYAVRLDDYVFGCSVVDTVSEPGASAYAGVRCRDRVRNKVANNLVLGGAPEIGVV